MSEIDVIIVQIMDVIHSGWCKLTLYCVDNTDTLWTEYAGEVASRCDALNFIHRISTSTRLYLTELAKHRLQQTSAIVIGHSSHLQNNGSLEVYGEIEPLVASLIVSGSRFRRDLDAIHGLENDKYFCLHCVPHLSALWDCMKFVFASKLEFNYSSCISQCNCIP